MKTKILPLIILVAVVIIAGVIALNINKKQSLAPAIEKSYFDEQQTPPPTDQQNPAENEQPTNKETPTEKAENKTNEDSTESQVTNNNEQTNNNSQTKTFTLNEVAQHNSQADCWLAIHGKVYDVTDFISSHPGGIAILQGCGKDATSLFETRPMGSGTPHSAKARNALEQYFIGNLK